MPLDLIYCYYLPLFLFGVSVGKKSRVVFSEELKVAKSVKVAVQEIGALGLMMFKK